VLCKRREKGLCYVGEGLALCGGRACAMWGKGLCYEYVVSGRT
jgi:hypothetical protein